ncbi:MAG: hypothetical protein K1X51_07280 [Rhodospirillaceae bacterium]|nr:hypothetical protein [Rhodospirillaceae bacterium]
MARLATGVLILAVAGLLASCSPQDKTFAGINAKLAELRKLPTPRAEDEFPPAFFEARDAVRDWLDSRMATMAEKGSDFEFTNTLNAELKAAKLLCPQCDASMGSFSDASGYLGEVRLSRKGSMLQAMTQVGVQCGFDENAYLYRWNGTKWQRVWDSSIAAKDGKYEPQVIEQVYVGEAQKDGPRLVAALARFPGCKSTWQPVYYRLWAMDGGLQAPQMVVNERGLAPVPQRGPAIQGRVTGDDDFLVEYQTESIDADVPSRTKVAHYRVSQGEGGQYKAEKIMPYAQTPREFVEEWVTSAWPEASVMTADAAQGPAREQHEHLHRDRVRADFTGPTTHCDDTAYGEWQVRVTFHNNPAKDGEERYFHMRWAPPTLFELLAVNEKPNPKCTDEVPRIDARRSLFRRY